MLIYLQFKIKMLYSSAQPIILIITFIMSMLHYKCNSNIIIMEFKCNSNDFYMITKNAIMYN
jgi:hypothetical protein